MTTYFLDSSALVKRYAQEVGSEWILAITEPAAAHTILLAEISLVEVAAAFAAQQRSRPTTDPSVGEEALSRFLQDCDEHYVVLQVSRDVIDRAVRLPSRYRLRGYDAVQLARALQANDTLAQTGATPLVFVTADADLIEAARREGFAVENPLTHPSPEART